MSKRQALFYKLIILYLCIGLGLVHPLLAQDSIIVLALNSKPSIVAIRALQAKIVRTADTKALINTKTGKTIIQKKGKVPFYERNGAGVILDSSGLIVTNFHTLVNANYLIVKLLNYLSPPLSKCQKKPLW